MRTTFAALRLRNYRLFATGSLVSNIGTWMQRIAQDWLVLTLTGSAGALGITTGLAVPADPAVLPDRRRAGRSLPEAAHPRRDPGRDGRHGRHPRSVGHHRLGDRLARLRDRVPVRHRHRDRHAGPAGVRPRDGAPRPTPERGRAQLGVVQPGPRHRPGDRGRADRRGSDRASARPGGSSCSTPPATSR